VLAPDELRAKRGSHIVTFVAERISFSELSAMVLDRSTKALNPPSNWAEIWHLWTVIMPRRSINGQLVFGKVWRRHDGRQWIYKKFTEYGDEEAA
jgi:hypothetical protein